MSTLSNVKPRRGGENPPDAGLTSDVLSETGKTEAGVSVGCAQTSDKHWFVLRVSYNRLEKARALVEADQVESYYPVHYVYKVVNGQRKRLLVPLLPNLLFVYSTREYLEYLIKKDPQNTFITYYYNHFEYEKEGRKNVPLTVNDRDMENFIRVTRVNNEHVRTVELSQCRFKSGDRVRVIDGEFCGVIGRVARVAGQQRVIVELEGLCLVATAYIPSAFMELVK